jgi:hypothetical protein
MTASQACKRAFHITFQLGLEENRTGIGRFADEGSGGLNPAKQENQPQRHRVTEAVDAGGLRSRPRQACTRAKRMTHPHRRSSFVWPARMSGPPLRGAASAANLCGSVALWLFLVCACVDGYASASSRAGTRPVRTRSQRRAEAARMMMTQIIMMTVQAVLT